MRHWDTPTGGIESGRSVETAYPPGAVASNRVLMYAGLFLPKIPL